MIEPKILELFQSKINEGKVILASSSPRRREIFDSLGVVCRILSPGFDEKPMMKMVERNTGPWYKKIGYAARVQEKLLEIVMGKYLSIEKKAGKDLVFCFDTVVLDSERLYGKPASRAEAVKFLGQLSGRTHLVATACLAACQGNFITRTYVTPVEFKPLSKAFIEKYITQEKVLDAAGAYKVQGRGLRLIKAIHGSYHNVMGMPIEFVTQFQ